MDELKPCPMCGGAADITDADGDQVCVKCTNCGVYHKGATESLAIHSWNRRPTRLKPCPFCKSDKTPQVLCVYKISIGQPSEFKGYQVRCMVCPARAGIYDTAEEAETVWNRRVADES